MKVISQSFELDSHGRRVCAAVGVFDGVHLGHQQVIRRALSDAQRLDAVSVVITFDRHPSAVFAPDRVPSMIQTQAQRLKVFESMGVDVVWLIPFDRAFSEKTGEQFIRELVRDFQHLRVICVGHDFVFGHRRSGNVELLKTWGRQWGYEVHGLASVALDGEVVSSTRIRQAIQAGRLDLAEEMLGRSWTLAGKVVRGEQLGRKLGFPTANVDCSAMVLPPTGVYAVTVTVNGASHRGVMNIGYRPTVTDRQAVRPTVEVHLLGEPGDLYGATLEVVLVEKIREEQKFASLEALVQRIGQDIVEAKRLFEG